MNLAVRCLFVLIALGLAACGSNPQPQTKTAAKSESPGAPASGPAPQPWLFSEAPDGPQFDHINGETPSKFMPEILSGGVAVADFTGDGAPDLLFVQSGELWADQPNQTHQDRFFINDGRGNFTDATDTWRPPLSGYAMGVAVGDFDGDGRNDYYLTGFNGAELLARNTGAGFEDVTQKAGLGKSDGWSSSAGFIDYDRDGDLDLYIVHYIQYDRQNAAKCFEKGVHVYCSPLLYQGQSDRMMRNNGDGTFTDVTKELGLDQYQFNGLALTIADMDANGWPDIYVACDTTRNQLLMNHNGRFTDEAQTAGVAYGETGAEEAGMGADAADVDGNGLLDLVCTNFQDEPTNLYRQIAPLVFLDAGYQSGIGEPARRRLSFGIRFADLDNDGDHDLAMANGHIYQAVTQFSEGVEFAQANSIFENNGKGVFAEITQQAGPALAQKAVTRGLASGDFDGDGGIDLVFVNNGGQAQVLFNRGTQRGRFVGLQLHDKHHTDAVGSVVTATLDNGQVLTRHVVGASSYLSASQAMVHLGIGDARAVTQLTIKWPDGTKEDHQNLPAGSWYRIEQGGQPQKNLYRQGG